MTTQKGEREEALKAALKKLTFLARTSGGWKRDESLCAACDEAERLLSPGLISRSKEWWLAKAEAEGDHVIVAGVQSPPPDAEVEKGEREERETQDAIERVILRRLYEKRIEGYTLEMAEEIAALLSSSKAEGEMREALTACEHQFEFCAREHAVNADRALSAGKLDEAQASAAKAKVNAEFAARARAALTPKDST